MIRSNARELAVHLIYSMDCTGETADQILQARLEQDYYANLAQENDIYQERPNQKQLEYIKGCVAGVAQNRGALRNAISRYAVGWKIHRISRYTMAVLELAMYEMLFVDDVPDNVAINEAVTLTKKYEDPEVGSFVNGILGAFLRDGKQLNAPQETPAEDSQL